jgi:hypothetical protein
MKNNKQILLLTIMLFFMLTIQASAVDSGSEQEADDRGAVTLEAVGKGILDVDEEGRIICVPDEGFETESITADRDAGGIEAGSQIPELEIGDLEFSSGTTVTAVFEPEAEDDSDFGMPESATALFG